MERKTDGKLPEPGKAIMVKAEAKRKRSKAKDIKVLDLTLKFSIYNSPILGAYCVSTLVI
jgi:hypothetical protein